MDARRWIVRIGDWLFPSRVARREQDRKREERQEQVRREMEKFRSVRDKVQTQTIRLDTTDPEMRRLITGEES